MMPILSSLVVTEVVVLTTSEAANKSKLGIMTNYPNYFRMILLTKSDSSLGDVSLYYRIHFKCCFYLLENSVLMYRCSRTCTWWPWIYWPFASRIRTFYYIIFYYKPQQMVMFIHKLAFIGNILIPNYDLNKHMNHHSKCKITHTYINKDHKTRHNSNIQSAECVQY